MDHIFVRCKKVELNRAFESSNLSCKNIECSNILKKFKNLNAQVWISYLKSGKYTNYYNIEIIKLTCIIDQWLTQYKRPK